MLSLMKRVFVEYKTLMVHMNNDLNCVVATKTNLEYLCDLEVVMGLMCIMPMLKAAHGLIKFVQACDTFLCDFVTIIKLCCPKLSSCILIQKQSMANNISNYSWTCMIVAMTNCLLLGGLIQQQTFNM